MGHWHHHPPPHALLPTLTTTTTTTLLMERLLLEVSSIARTMKHDCDIAARGSTISGELFCGRAVSISKNYDGIVVDPHRLFVAEVNEGEYFLDEREIEHDHRDTTSGRHIHKEEHDDDDDDDGDDGMLVERSDDDDGEDYEKDLVHLLGHEELFRLRRRILQNENCEGSSSVVLLPHTDVQGIRRQRQQQQQQHEATRCADVGVSSPHEYLGPHLLELIVRRRVCGVTTVGGGGILFRLPSASKSAPAGLTEMMKTIDAVYRIAGRRPAMNIRIFDVSMPYDSDDSSVTRLAECIVRDHRDRDMHLKSLWEGLSERQKRFILYMCDDETSFFRRCKLAGVVPQGR